MKTGGIEHRTSLFAKGDAFILGGGYTVLHRKQLWTSFKKNAVEVITIIVAVGGLVLTYWQASTSNKTDKLEVQMERQKNEIIQFQKSFDSQIELMKVPVAKLDSGKGK